MKKTWLLIFILTFSLTLTGCGQKSQKQAEKEIKNEMEKTLGEAIGAAKNKKNYFDLSQIKEYKNIGEEFTLSFQTREYDSSKKQDYDEWMKAAKIGTGKLTYKITDKKTVDKIGIWEPKQGNQFLVVYLEVTGDSANKGMPGSFGQTGTDPAPQFYLVDKNGTQLYSQAAEASSLAFSEKLQSPLTLEVNDPNSAKTDVVFQVAQNIEEPTLVIKTKVGENQYEYRGIKLY